MSDAILPAGVPALEDPLNYYEDADFSISEHLGLRRTVWVNDDMKASHPDQRPCPSWCWVGQHPEFGHQVERETPWEAVHSTEFNIHVGASLYDTSRDSTHVVAATFEPYIEQVGQGEAIIRIAFRGTKSGTREPVHRTLMKLSLADTRDLVTALTYLVTLAEAD